MPHKKSSFGLVPYAKFIWEGSIVCLLLFLVAAILFDAYIFFGKIQQLQSTIYDPVVEISVEDIKEGPLNQAREIIKKRANLLEPAGDNLPKKNPFQP